MATFHDSKALSASQARRFAHVDRVIRAEHRRLVEQMLGHAVAQTSGPISSATLRALGHPFGRGRGRINAKGRMRIGPKGVAPKLPINAQTGELRRSWRITRKPVATGQVFELAPTSPHAIVLAPGGTKRMVARGFWTMMRTEFKRKNRVSVQRMRYMALLEMRKG